MAADRPARFNMGLIYENVPSNCVYCPTNRRTRQGPELEIPGRNSKYGGRAERRKTLVPVGFCSDAFRIRIYVVVYCIFALDVEFLGLI